MKEKKEYIYCSFCGEKNDKAEKFCNKCKESLSPKNHLLREYVVDHFRDDLKENAEDSECRKQNHEYLRLSGPCRICHDRYGV